MYSAVLMLAMTGAADLPAHCFGRRCDGCSGCYGGGYGSCWGGGYGGCSGGYGGCYGCSGGHKHHRFGGDCSGGCFGGMFSRRHSCHGGHGCHGGYGCNGGYGYYGCHGGYGCYGDGGYVVCTGGVIGAGCDGATVAPPIAAPGPEPVPGPKPPKREEKKGTMGPAPATIIVTLPADARLTIDGAITTSTSATRVFVSPDLDPEREFQYTLKAEWEVEGKTLAVTRKVTVTAGRETSVTMRAEAASVASR